MQVDDICSYSEVTEPTVYCITRITKHVKAGEE